MKYNFPPFNEKEKHGFFEQKILDFSKGLFKNKVFGIALALILNIVFFGLYFKSKSCFSIIISIFLVYLIFSIILFQLLNPQINK